MFRRVLPLAASLLVFSPGAYAQPLPDRAPIKGVVVDEAGRPIASAVLTVRRQDEASPTAFWGAEARADESGRFLFPDAEEGRYFVNVDAPGFATLESFALDWKSASPPARLRLLRLGQLTLRLVAPDGKPLSQSPVWIRLRDNSSQSPTRATTNMAGEVVIPNVAPSSYSLVVVAEGGIATQSDLAFDSTKSAPFKAQLRQGATLHVKATDVKGVPLGGASLIVFAQSPEEAMRLGGTGADPGENWALLAAANAPQALVSHDGDGTLQLDHLPVGRFSARLSVPGYGTQTRDFALEEGNVVEWNATFPTRPAANLSLQVRDGRGQAVANTLVALRLLPLAENGTFADPNAEVPDPNAPPDLPFDSSSGSGARVAMTDATGQVTLFPVRAGRYRIFASRVGTDAWLRSSVAPEGVPSDVAVAATGDNKGQVQVP